MKLLSLSTSTRRGSVAVIEGARVLAEVAYDDARGHAERLFDAIDEALAASGSGRSSLEAIACDVGPGSFTGVRVGVAAAKGIALALAVPAFAARSLEAIACAAFGGGRARAGDVVVAAIDAKKDELFVGAFDAALGEIAPPRHVARRDAIAYATAPGAPGARFVLAGEVWAELSAPDLAVERGEALDLPHAVWIARAALARRDRAGGGDPAALEPAYVRAPDARPMDPPGARRGE